MFRTFFTREVMTGLKQPMIYIFFFIYALLVFLAIVSDNVSIGDAVGLVAKNSPHVVTIYTSILTLFGLLAATAFFNNAALRDHRYQFNEILFTTPLSKFGYYFGRFSGAYVLSCLCFMGIFLGFILGSWLGPVFGWIDQGQVGPIYWSAFISNAFIYILPNMLLGGALIFGLAAKFRSTPVSFVGALLLIIGYLVAFGFLSDIENETLAALLDPLGVNTYSVQSQYYTPIEKNTLIPSFSGLLLQNRLLWVGISLAIGAFFYSIFSFRKQKQRPKSGNRAKAVETLATPPVISKSKSFSGVSNGAQFWSFFKLNFQSIVKSPVFIILFVFCTILVIAALWGGFEYFGLKSYPVTYKMMETISGQSSIFLLIVMVFYSGELVWRDRDVRIHEVVGATPYSTLLSLLAKSLSLVVVIICLYAAMVFVGVGYQLVHGFTDINIGLYFKDFIIDSLPAYITWSFIMIFIQVLINHKYIGYFISILVIILTETLLSVLGIESNMMDIGGTPSVIYSDMNGFGPGLKSAMWFSIYWIIFGFMGLIKAAAFWQRGTSRGFWQRAKLGARNLFGNYAKIMWPIFILWLAVAGYIYYNTQILNSYDTGDEVEKQLADYEKTYKQYEHLPKLSIDDAKYFIDIFPKSQRVKVNSKFRIRNKTKNSIDYMHFIMDENWNHEIRIPGATLEVDDTEIGYQIYKFSPLSPGDSMNIEIDASYDIQGFENTAGNRSIVENGTFLNNGSFLPQFGYSSGFELDEKFTRRKYDLPPKDRMPDLETSCSAACNLNYLTQGSSDWIEIETVISTSSDQIAVAPGSLIREWKEGDRNYYHYKVDHKSQNFCSFMSANYEKAHRKWRDVDIEVYYDAQHPYNVEMMLDAVERSLSYYVTNFGPYYHKQARIIEFPRYASFAQAFPGTMPYSEAIGFIIDLEDEEKNNVVDAVIAHEMAHQWWAHQVISSWMQGGTMLVESFAEYSSLMVMKNQLNDDIKMKEFLKYDFNRYFLGRAKEEIKEVPLNKVENQPYIHYGKGAVVLYALQDYLGEYAVNQAMKSFLEEYRYAPPPYPTTHDFIRHLRPQVPDSLTYLIHDWIEVITLYDFRLEQASILAIDNGNYQVEVEIYAEKLKADSVGNETPLGINDWVDIGFYSDKDEKELFYYERVKLVNKKTTLRFDVDKNPIQAGIDPRRMLIERLTSDNVKTVNQLK